MSEAKTTPPPEAPPEAEPPKKKTKLYDVYRTTVEVIRIAADTPDEARTFARAKGLPSWTWLEDRYEEEEVE
jgi:hypothetical protein